LSQWVQAPGYTVVDAFSGRVFYASNSGGKVPVGGLAKVVSEYVVFDWLKLSGGSLDQGVRVASESLSFGGYNPLNLAIGDTLSVRDALYSALLGGDDVAMDALGSYVGEKLLEKRNKAGDSRLEFMSEVRGLLAMLDLNRTRVLTPHGLGQREYSTASNMAVLFIHAMKDPGFAYFVNQPNRVVKVKRSLGSEESFVVESTNTLLGQLGVIGGKVSLGRHIEGGAVSYAQRPVLVHTAPSGKSIARPRKLVVVVLGGENLQENLKGLLLQGQQAYDQWAANDYPTSVDLREFLPMPSSAR